MACGVAGSFVFRFARQLQHVGDVLHVLGAGLLGGVSGAEIVVAFRQAQAALVDHGDLLAGILEILLLAKAHESVDADQLEAGEQFGQLVFALEGGNAIELRLQRFQSLLVDGVHIHAGGVGVADLLLIRSAAGAARGGLFQHGVQDVFGVVGNHGAGCRRRNDRSGMGYSLEKLPQAYWKKSVHGSAVVSISRLSRPGKRSGGFCGSALPAAGVCASEAADRADRDHERSYRLLYHLIFPLRFRVHAVDKPTLAFDGRARNL